ncbi:MAG: HEPN domain-containing protein [Armatimonadota bacterium]
MSIVQDWVDKAEADFAGAETLDGRQSAPLPDLVCYHCQQSAEKYLKAYLLARGASPPRIHDLVQLLNLCCVFDPSLSTLSAEIQALDAYGVMIRYPGMSATVQESKDALRFARTIRAGLRSRLGL